MPDLTLSPNQWNNDNVVISRPADVFFGGQAKRLPTRAVNGTREMRQGHSREPDESINGVITLSAGTECRLRAKSDSCLGGFA